jgi:predicted metal-dependent peptidase
LSSNTDTRAKGLDPKDFYKDEPESGRTAEKLLQVARFKLLSKAPFFGKIALNMALIEQNHLPTTAVDQKGRLYFNRKWVNAFSLEDAIFEFAHETMHLFQRSFNRRPKGANPSTWNKACDWVADTQLVTFGLTQSKISKIMVDAAAMAKVNELETIEKVYKYLVEQGEEGDCEACKLEQSKVKQSAKDEDKHDKAEGKQDDEENEGDSEGDGGSGEEEGAEGNKSPGEGS